MKKILLLVAAAVFAFAVSAAPQKVDFGKLPKNSQEFIQKNFPGEKVKAVLLKETFDSPAESDMMISMLAAYGIPCFKYYEKEGGAGKVINGFSGYGASLYVPQTMLEDAQNILNAEAVEEDENDAELHE